MHAPHALLSKFLVLFVALTLATVFVGCGDEDDDGCPSAGATVEGIQGIVMTPNCNYPASSATITARHGNGASLTATSGPDGKFSIPADQLEDGRWQLSVVKGPFVGESVQETTVSGTTSDYVVLKLAQ